MGARIVSDDINETDLFDDELGAALRGLAPVQPNADLDAAMPRFVRARRRRIATNTGAVLVGAAAVVGVIALAGGGGGVTGVRTHEPAGRPSTTSDSPSTSSTSRPLTPAPTSGMTSTTRPTTAVPPPSTGSVPPATSAPPSTRTETFRSAGGSVVASIGDRTVTLVRSEPAAGYTADVRASGPSEVEVRFRMGSSGGTEHRIRLRFESDGTFRPEIT
jgi:hypothetical protein